MWCLISYARCYFLFIKRDVGKVRYEEINLCQTSVFHFPCQARLVRGSLSSGSSFRLMGWSHCCNMAWGTNIINTDVLPRSFSEKSVCLIISQDYNINNLLSPDRAKYKFVHKLCTLSPLCLPSCGSGCLHGMWQPAVPTWRAAPSWPTCRTQRSKERSALVTLCTGSNFVWPSRKWCPSQVRRHLRALAL